MIPRRFQIAVMLLLLGILISGIYIIKITHKEQAKTQLAADERPVAPPVGGRQERIQVLVAYDEDRALRWRETTVFMPEERSLRAKEALRAVLTQYLQSPSPHALGKGTDIKNVYLINYNTLLVDTTSQFADAHPSGILPEEMTLTSLIETLSANLPDVTRVKFIVDGKERETLAGHVDLMSFYEVSAIHELAKEFE
jgi:hypothetical protein